MLEIRPQNIPPKMSKGKCTPKYTLLYPIRVAQEKRIQNIQNLLKIILMKNAIAKLLAACEEMNEYKPPHPLTTRIFSS